MSTSAERTREQLMTSALEVVRTKGLAAASARAIGAHAGVNQALIFYHFGTVTELIEAASDEAVGRAVDGYRDRFDRVTSLSELFAVGMQVHEQERRIGNVAVMAQLMAGAQHDPVLARASSRAIGLWTDQIRRVLDRVLAGTAAETLLDSADLAHALSAGFIGIELYHGVDPTGANRAFATMERLESLIATINDLSPVAQRAVRAAGRRLGERAEKRLGAAASQAQRSSGTTARVSKAPATSDGP